MKSYSKFLSIDERLSLIRLHRMESYSRYATG